MTGWSRPLDRVGRIKLKLGLVVFASVCVIVLVLVATLQLGWPRPARAGAALLLALASVQVLARGMTSPLREMAAAARAMARGDYSRRVRASSRDEVGELARAFNAMAAELAEVDRLRRDLVANVSHELRTPIGALRAVLENLVDGVGSADRETLASMLRQAERLSRLVDQLLDLSRLEAGTVPLVRARFGAREFLASAVRESADEWRHATGAEPPRVRVSVDPPELALDADPDRMRQVVGNLVANALRHSPVDEAVEVRAREHPAHVVLEVADHGPGIPEHEAHRVFERFHRIDGARSADAGGSGLGLAIARWIVDLHGGRIRAENNDPTGCLMVVELPREVT